MNNIIKIFFFKILLIIIFTTHLNSYHVILIQTQDYEEFHMKKEIPILVLKQVKAQFPDLEIDDKSFKERIKKDLVKEWGSRPSAQLYLLDILVEEGAVNPNKRGLRMNIFKYELELDYRFRPKDIPRFVDSRPAIIPVMIEFFFNKIKTKDVSKRKEKLHPLKEVGQDLKEVGKDLKEVFKDLKVVQKDLKDIAIDNNELHKGLKEFGTNHMDRQKRHIKVQSISIEQKVKECREILDYVDSSMAKLPTLLQKDMEYKRFKHNLQEKQKSINENIIRLEQCIKEPILDELHFDKKLDFAQGKDKESISMKVINLKIEASGKIEHWPLFNQNIINLLKTIKEWNSNQGRGKIKTMIAPNIMNNEVMEWLRNKYKILFINSSDNSRDRDYESRKPFERNPRKLPESDSEDEYEDNYKYKKPFEGNPRKLSVDEGDYENIQYFKRNPSTLSEDEDNDNKPPERSRKNSINLIDLYTSIHYKKPENRDTVPKTLLDECQRSITITLHLRLQMQDYVIKLDIPTNQTEKDEFNKKTTIIDSNLNITIDTLKKSVEKLKKLKDDLSSYHGEEIDNLLWRINLILGCPWNEFIQLIRNTIDLFVKGLWDMSSMLIQNEIDNVKKFYSEHMEVDFKSGAPKRQEGAWGGAKAEDNSKDPWKTGAIRNELSDLGNFILK